MYIVRNALKCIGRSKGRNILIGIIVLVIAVSACVGLSIRQAAQSARETALSNLSITGTISFDRRAAMQDMNGEEGFDRDKFKTDMSAVEQLSAEDYEKYAQAESVSGFYYTVTASLNGNDDIEPVSSEEDSQDASNENAEALEQPEGGFGGNMHKGAMGGKSFGDFNIVGYSSDEALTSFTSGSASITSGEMFEQGTEELNCVISEELASYNNLKSGDEITLVNPNDEDESYTLKISGVYSDTSSNEGAQGFNMDLFSDPANKILMSSTALDSLIAKSSESAQTKTDDTTGREYSTALQSSINATYVFDDVESYESFEEEVREMGLPDNYSVSSQDINSFENSLVPLNTLSTMAGWFLLVILIIGAIILIVLNIFNVRERKYEIGVLAAMGMKKSRIAAQFLVEIFAVTAVAVIIGAAIGAVSSVPVTNTLLENQISSQQEQSEQIQKNFGRGGEQSQSMQKPGANNFGRNPFGSAASYVSEISSAMNLTVAVQMLGIAVLLTLVSGAVSMLFVMRYEPLKILANRD